MAFKSAKGGAFGKQLKEFLGDLVLVTPVEFREQFNSGNFGPKDTIFFDFVVLDGDNAGEEVVNSSSSGVAIVKDLRSEVGGDPILGRVGHSKAKAGQKPALILSPPSKEDEALATEYLDSIGE